MRKWPEVNKMARPSSSRGGQKHLPSDKVYNKVQIDVETEMPCGKQFTDRKRVKANLQYNTEDEMLRNIGNQARDHLRKCSKSQCVAKRG